MNIYLMSIDSVTQADFEYISFYMPQRYKKAMRFRNESDRKLCVAAGVLIAHTTGISDEGRICTEKNGKPYITGGPCISVSHSGIFAAVAVSNSSIGLDIQKKRNIDLPLLRRICTDEEYDWAALDERRRYLLWTFKEAVVKEDGRGLLMDMNTFSVLPFFADLPVLIEGKRLTGKFLDTDEYALSIVSSGFLFEPGLCFIREADAALWK